MNSQRLPALYAGMLALLLSAAALANGPQQSGERRGPPQEAVEACADKQVEDTCEFSGRRGESVTGSCAASEQQSDAPLACKPDSAPEGGRQR